MNVTALGRLLTRRLRRCDLLAVDAVLALGLAVVCVYAATDAPPATIAGVREPAWLSWVVGLVVAVPVAVRRRWPIPVAAGVLATSVAAVLSGVIPSYAAAAPSAALTCAFYSVGIAINGRRSTALLTGCLAAIAAALAAAAAFHHGATSGMSFAGLMPVGALILGWAVRSRRSYAAQAAEQMADRALSEERLRIARELHDVVAHSMSLIVVKSAIANHVAQADPEHGREALRVIEATSRGALQEMRRVVGLLRDDPSYAPARGLRDLPVLAEQAADGGVDVELDVRGGTDVPEGIGLSVFRIVQESLTNVVKHAAPARCRATVCIDPREVRIEVTDDGRRADAPSGGGLGLIGIRERVNAYGGEFAAGPRPEGGFTMTARLPYGPVT